ncbi:MAG: MmcQ/YjbR family DNA-binding protein [Chthoniobacterales bacterium]|nr:MmcQ/YjbR family DNA-binding protein [Chthoniobacterales bacterium]
MSPAEFSKLALSLPETIEGAHMGHTDFRIDGKIFATLGYPDESYGMVAIPTEDQADFIARYPLIFSPAKGAWGRRGSTLVRLKEIKVQLLRKAMTAAWQKRAPKQLQDNFDL